MRKWRVAKIQNNGELYVSEHRHFWTKWGAQREAQEMNDAATSVPFLAALVQMMAHPRFFAIRVDQIATFGK